MAKTKTEPNKNNGNGASDNAPAPTREQMTELITGVRSHGVMALNEFNKTYFGQFGADNPALFNMSIQPKQSHATALGISWSNSVQLYDLFREMADKNPTIYFGMEKAVAAAVEREMRIETKIDGDDKSEAAILLRQQIETDIMNVNSPFNWQYLIAMGVKGPISDGFAAVENVWEVADRDSASPLLSRERYVPAAYVHQWPGYFSFDRMARLYAMDKSGDYKLVLPMKYCLFNSPGMDGNPFGDSALYKLRHYWMFNKSGLHQWVIYCDLYGHPIAVATIKNGTAEWATEKANVEAALKGLNEETALVLKDNVTVEFQDRGGTRGGSPHEGLVEWTDRKMLIAIVGAILDVDEAQFGSRAQADTHGKSSKTYNKPNIKRTQDAISRDVIGPYLDLNLSPEMRPRVEAKLIIDCDEQRDVALAIQIADSARDLELDQSKEQLREWFGVEMAKDEMDRVKPRPMPQPFGGPMGGNQEENEDEDDLSFAERKKKALNSPKARKGEGSLKSDTSANGRRPRWWLSPSSPLTF